MENTLTIYVEALHEHWNIPDTLALKWTEYEKEHPLADNNSNADSLHQFWLATLPPEEQQQISRKKAEE